jgi:DNA-binding LacI/PurR family transcriptional regulator
MATSADVATHAGLSRSTVSQILNGREHLFTEDTIARVRASAAALGYRPSLAGRTLARGTSDIVITLLSNVTFNPRLRELVDLITDGVAKAGLTNLIRFTGSEDSLEDAILGLKPYGLVSLTPLPVRQRDRLLKQGVHIVEQPQDVQAEIDRAIGRLQVQHLAAAGYPEVAIALPNSAREQSFAAPREAGAQEWARANGIGVLPTRHVEFERGGPSAVVRELPYRQLGIAAYNDEIALAVLGAVLHDGRRVPEDVGIIGIDNSPIARASTPSITTVDYDIDYSANGIIEMLLQNAHELPAGGVQEVEQRLRVIQGETTLEP